MSALVRSRRRGQPSAALLEAVATIGANPDCLRRERKPGPPRPVERWRCADLVLEDALTSDGSRLLQLEVAGRHWARSIGIPAPDVVHHDPKGGVLVSRWLTARSCRGKEPTLAALAVADQICGSELPPSSPEPSTWRGKRLTSVPRVARLVLGAMPVHHYLKQREAYNSLHNRAAAHGDYYRRNVLLHGSGDLSIVDWEHLSLYPRWTDHVRLWSTLTESTDRQLVLEHLNENVPSWDQRHLSVVMKYLTCRLLGENLAAPNRYRNADDLAHARRMIEEGEEVARSLTQ